MVNVMATVFIKFNNAKGETTKENGFYSDLKGKLFELLLFMIAVASIHDRDLKNFCQRLSSFCHVILPEQY